jgi:hypothetical protein
VSTQRAVEAIRALDQSDRTGMIVVVDGAADEWRPLDRAAS